MTLAREGTPRVENRLTTFAEPVIVTAPTAAPPRKGTWITSRTAVVALVLLGTGLRTIPMLQNRNLWIDEAMLALNLVERSPAGLLEPLGWNQGAPTGFLLAVKGTIALLGASEWALRLVPFVASVLGLIVFVRVARKFLPPPAATLAVALAAVNPFLISYAAECKQYATDAALAIGLFAVAFGLLHGEGGTRRWAVLAGCGAAAVWFSHPAVFVLGGIGTALFLDAALKHDRTRVLACAAVIGCWLGSFGLCYVTTLKQLGNNQYLLTYWDGHFLPLPPKEPGDLAWLAEHYFGFFAYPGGLGGTEVKAGGVAALLFVVGMLAFWRERWPVAVAIGLPALLALFASGLHRYPFAGRLLLFLVPFTLLAVARGACALAAGLRYSQPLAAVLVVGLILLAPVVETYQQVRRPLRCEQITEVLDDVKARLRPGDKVYLYYGGIPAFTFYSREAPFPAEVIPGNEYRNRRTAYRDELRRLAGSPRVWVVFSHRHQAEESLLRAYADGLGECRHEIHRPGAAAFLYDFGPRK